MQKIRAIIVDDEPNARRALQGLLEENFSQVEVVADCKNVPEAVKTINKLKPDLVFLDIAMPGYSGFELLDFFDEQHLNFKIIFVTAYSEHSLRAFETSAVDYILKPVDLGRFNKAVDKAKQISENFKVENKKEEELYIKKDSSYVKLNLNEVFYQKQKHP